MPNTFPYPAIIAHRGGRAFAPENTLSAFQYALDSGADGIELDVHLSADGEVVVIHDASLGRTTNGSGLVFEKTLSELRELDAGSWFGKEFVGQKIPTLSEVFELVDERLFVNVELKGSGLFQSALPEKVAEIVRRFSLTASVIISSYNPWLLRQTSQLLPETKLGLLFMPGFLAGVKRLLSKPVITPWAYHPYYRTVTPDFIAQATREGHPVLAYTVNDPAEIKRLCALGIYGIITDDPVTALAVRAD
jgi:glycerophosphoryl diester phosphodiesterase